MAPRRYDMQRRGEAKAATRERIVDAAKALHAELGVRATSWEQIAERARVSLATVYRHFPGLDDLVPACARSVFDVIKPPTLEEAQAKFATIDEPSERLAMLVRRSVHCYTLGEGWLHAAYRERDFLPALRASLDVIQGTLHVLVSAAASRKLRRAEHAKLFVLCDFPFFKSLLDAGLDRRAAERAIIETVTAIEREGRT